MPHSLSWPPFIPLNLEPRVIRQRPSLVRNRLPNDSLRSHLGTIYTFWWTLRRMLFHLTPSCKQYCPSAEPHAELQRIRASPPIALGIMSIFLVRSLAQYGYHSQSGNLLHE
ncbi:hypothetical protein OE88DRAFT_403464 [Heliocybe sulcata]|uniref:Uncharacterized protein n=1 Tax=Heliocybe sulcata TaxID=5364 RepID=A0A5C3MW72_9AGAM|nr:hypothetical protein OE88DRAFT_403464 [Heliocybe sulcata]